MTRRRSVARRPSLIIDIACRTFAVLVTYETRRRFDARHCIAILENVSATRLFRAPNLAVFSNARYLY